MTLSNLIAREIEKRLGLEKFSYKTTGIISESLNFCEIAGKGELVPNSRRDIGIEALDEPIFKGTVVFLYDSYTDKGLYFHEPVTNPTVVDLQLAMDKGAEFADNKKHVFLEDLSVIRDRNEYFSNDFFEGIEIPELGNVYLVDIERGS